MTTEEIVDPLKGGEEELEKPDFTKSPDLEGCGEVLSLSTWVDEMQKDPESCTPCGLSMVVPWYRDALRQTGHDALADEVAATHEEVVALVEAGADDGEAMSRVASLLDRVKEDVENEPLRDHLVLYDCTIQQEDLSDEEGEDDGETILG